MRVPMNLVAPLSPRLELCAFDIARGAWSVFLLLSLAGTSTDILGESGFEKRVLTDLYYCDGVTSGDINRDGTLDIIAGPFWYEGPGFETSHPFYPPAPLDTAASPSNSMFSYVWDFNRDGWLDVLVLGRVHLHQAFWYENPRGKFGEPWKRHFVFHRIKGESPPFADVDGDGMPELYTHNETHWGWVSADPNDATLPWVFHPLSEKGAWEPFYHGTGLGDMNGDGRQDLLLHEGWFERPKGFSAEQGGLWLGHSVAFGEGRGGAQMFTYDVDGDGDQDVLTSLDSHGWGLAWFERVGSEEAPRFVMHPIMGDRSEEGHYGVAFSQPHALEMGDMNGDGLMDLVTGKRRWAHGPKGDVEPNAPPVLYWFELRREPTGQVRFVPHLIDDASGVGVQLHVVDVNGDGLLDVMSASKLGTFLFIHR